MLLVLLLLLTLSRRRQQLSIPKRIVGHLLEFGRDFDGFPSFAVENQAEFGFAFFVESVDEFGRLRCETGSQRGSSSAAKTLAGDGERLDHFAKLNEFR